MSLSALIAALLLEQLKPLWSHQFLRGWSHAYVDFFQHHFNSGEYSHGRTAWWLAVLPMVAGSVLVFRGLHHLHPVLSFIFNVLVLYLCMGFRRYSQLFAKIQQALRGKRPDQAREFLAALRGRPANDLNAEEVARVTIETSLFAALHHLFGVIVWFVVFTVLGLGGAAGVLLYVLARAMGTYWRDESGSGKPSATSSFAQELCRRLEWLPVRLTAATFAIVGNFEDTVYCWRSQAPSWPDGEAGILLASAAGATGVRLGLPIAGDDTDRPELGVGDKTDDMALYCTSRLVWRSSVFMLLTLFMLTLAGLLR